jgi:murein tripeptide amidase MpaA
MRRRSLSAVLLGAGGLLAFAGAAEAGVGVAAQASGARACHTDLRPHARSTDTFEVTAPVTGLVRARIAGGRGDWDLGVFGADGTTVAGSAAARSNELAEGFVTEGQRLTVQACRYAGAAGAKEVGVSYVDLGSAARATQGELAQVVSVKADLAGRNRLTGLGLDVSEHLGESGRTDVITYSEAERTLLAAAGFHYQVEVADLAAEHRQARRAVLRDEARAEAAPPSELPSGRTSYRRLADYEAEMKALAAANPNLLKVITLSRQTLEGRDIMGLELTRDVNASDGKPIFLNLGVHHAREWPSSEHVLEFVYDVVRQYRGNPRTRFLANATRLISVPIVNPDGFNVSREAARVPPELAFSAVDLEMRRKNCRPAPGVPSIEDCSTLPRTVGVDLNRNYGGYWGGPGASTNPLSDTYRGEAPFSEPEVQAVRELARSRNVTNLITNHTYSDLVLRPPGVAAAGVPVDEPGLREVGSRMAQANGYANIPSYGLYDTSGTTEDYTYWTLGGFGYTFEIGLLGFHPDDFQAGVVAEYLGQEPAAGAGRGGNRLAYLRMLQATHDRRWHAQLQGDAPRGSRLTLSKENVVTTSPVIQPDGTTTDPIEIPDPMAIELTTSGGRWTWNVNPSTSPDVAGRYGREPAGPPSPPAAFDNPPGIPAENTNFPLNPEADIIPFEVPGAPDDNGEVTVHIEWTDPNTDWDLFVYDADGSWVASSASFGDTDEDAVLLFPEPGSYTARVVNYDQVDGNPADDWSGGEVRFASPQPAEPGITQAYTLTCERADGRATTPQQVEVDRGERTFVRNACRATG